MAFVITAIQVDEGQTDMVQAIILGQVDNVDPIPKTDAPMAMIWASHGPVPTISAPAPPIPYDPNYDFLRVYFIPMSVVIPSITDPNTFGIIFQKWGRNQWLRPTPYADMRSLLVQAITTNFPQPVSGMPSPFYFSVVCSDSSFGTIKSLFRQKYIQPNSDTNDFLLVDPATPTCSFSFKWATGTGPVMPSQLGGMISSFYIMTYQGKALVLTTTAPYLTWADFDPQAENQKFFFIAQSHPEIGTGTAPYVYNICSLQSEVVLCFDDNNNIDIRPVADAGDWEKLEINMGSSSIPEYFGRFSITGQTFGALLRTGAAGSMSLFQPVDCAVTPDYYFVIPTRVS